MKKREEKKEMRSQPLFQKKITDKTSSMVGLPQRKES